MPYPIIPFSSEWEIPTTYKTSTNSSQYGDSGFRQRETLSINPVDKSLPYSITLGTQAKVTLMDNFLTANIGKPVRIPYTSSSGTSSDDGKLYRYKEITQVFMSPSCSSFSIELIQIRRLKEI